MKEKKGCMIREKALQMAIEWLAVETSPNLRGRFSLSPEKFTNEIHKLYMDWFRGEVEKLERVDYGLYEWTMDAVDAQLAHDKEQMLEKCK